MRKALVVAALTLALACSARAGDIPNGVTGNGEMPFGVTNPPPPPQTIEQTGTQETAGEIPNGQPEAISTAVLNLLQSVLALL